MSQMDILYRAFSDFRQSTVEDEHCLKMRQAIVRAAADRDKVESQRTICTIEEDWVCAIEKGLPFLDKAIREERQFIRQHGEVIPIEKVRRVSKASVTHLARHSDLITRPPEEDEDIVPDELYMVENLTNYAVYENRFLYMLLCYLRDFVDLRYNKIIEQGNTYRANMSMAKTVTLGKRTITYQTQFSDEYRNDPRSSLDQKAKDIIRRIEDIQQVVAMLLATPLMRELAHVPMLKPPITRTNALRMDNALRESLSLYDYISAYNKDGFTVELIRKTFSPLPEVMADDFAETIELTTFLVYEYSNNLKSELKEAYQQEEIRRRDAEEDLRRRKLDELRRKIQHEGVSPEEYMLQMEERNRYLEKVRQELDDARAQILNMTEEKAQLQKNVHDLEVRIQVNEAETQALVVRHEAEMEALEAEHREEIAELERVHKEDLERTRTELLSELSAAQLDFETRMAQMKQDYESQTAAQEAEHRSVVEQMAAEHEATLTDMTARHEAAMTEAEERRLSEVDALNKRYEDDVDALNTKYDDCVQTYERSITEMKYDYEEQITVLGERACTAENELFDLREKHLIQRAELRALRYQRGKDSNEEDFTSEERFKELVDELAALDAFIGTHWKRAKRHIRHRYLWDEGET